MKDELPRTMENWFGIRESARSYFFRREGWPSNNTSELSSDYANSQTCHLQGHEGYPNGKSISEEKDSTYSVGIALLSNQLWKPVVVGVKTRVV
jgi:hypothetical protein